MAVGDGSTVGVAVGSFVSAATANAGPGMEVGGMGKRGGGADTGPSSPNGSDSRKSTMFNTPQLARLSPRTIKSSFAQVDLALDGKRMPRKVECPCVGGWGCVRNAGDGGGRGCGSGEGGVRDA